MSIKTETRTEYVDETGETFYGIYANQTNSNQIINLFDEVITELKRYTQQTSITYYHRITMVELVRVVKDRNMTTYNNKLVLGRAVNKKSGVKCSYTDKQKLQIIRTQLPELRQTTSRKELKYEIKLYPIIKPNTPYIGPTTLKPIIITIADVLKGTTPFTLPNLIEYEHTSYHHFYDMTGCKKKTEGYTQKCILSLEYKIIIIDRANRRILHKVNDPLRAYDTYELIYDRLLPAVLPYIYLPTPYRLYKRTRHQNRLLTLLVKMKKWDKKGNALLTGCKAIRYYDNDFLKIVEWNFTNYTTKRNLETFMSGCGYIQNKLYAEGTPITATTISKEIKIIDKKSYKDIALWLYKQF